MIKKTLVIVLCLFLCSITFAAGGKSYSGGGTKSYSSGSSRSYSTSKPKSYSSPSKSYSPSSKPKSYSSPKSSYSKPKTYTPSSKPKQPTTKPKPKSYTTPKFNSPSTNGKPKFQTDLTKAKTLDNSRKSYQKANPPPKPQAFTYTNKTGKKQTVKSDDKRVENVQKYVTPERYETYDNRASAFYGKHYRSPQPTVAYHDPYPSFFWYWLLSQDINTRAQWAYNHRNDMDESRYKDLLAKDKALEAKIQQLENGKTTRDSSYVPTQLKDNPELMYEKSFVDASLQNKPVSVGKIFLNFILWGGLILLVIGVIYIVFFKEF